MFIKQGNDVIIAVRNVSIHFPVVSKANDLFTLLWLTLFSSDLFTLIRVTLSTYKGHFRLKKFKSHLPFGHDGPIKTLSLSLSLSLLGITIDLIRWPIKMAP